VSFRVYNEEAVLVNHDHSFICSFIEVLCVHVRYEGFFGCPSAAICVFLCIKYSYHESNEDQPSVKSTQFLMHFVILTAYTLAEHTL